MAQSTIFDDTTILQWIEERGIDAVVKFGGKGGCWKTENGEPVPGRKSEKKVEADDGTMMNNPVIYTNNWLVDPAGKFHRLRWRFRNLVLTHGPWPRASRKNNFASQMERPYDGEHPSDRLNRLLCEKWEEDIVAAREMVPLVKMKGKNLCETRQTHYSMNNEKKAGEPLERPVTRYKLYFSGMRETKFLDQSRCTRGANGTPVFEPFFGGKVTEDNIHEVLKRGATATAGIISGDTTSFSQLGTSFARTLVMALLDHSTVDTAEVTVDDLGLDLSQFEIAEPAPEPAAAPKPAAAAPEPEEMTAEETSAGVDQMLDDMAGAMED